MTATQEIHDPAPAERPGGPANAMTTPDHGVTVQDERTTPAGGKGRGEGKKSGSAGGDLFGRGMLYVVIWSLQMVAATIVSPVLTFALGPHEFGALASAIALYQLLIVLVVFGIDQAIQLQRVEDGDDPRASRGLLGAGIVLATALTAIAALTAPLWLNPLGFSANPTLVLVTLLWTAPGAAVMMMLGYLQAEDRLPVFAAVSVLSSVGGQVLGIGLLLFVHRSAVVYAWGGVAGQGLAVLLGIVVTRPRLSGLRNRALLKRALHIGGPIMLSGLSIFVLNAGDRFILQRMMGSAEVGRYQVAYTIGYVIVLLLSFTNRAWVPRMAAITDEAARWEVIRSSRDGIYRLLAPAILGISLAAPALLRIVAPSSFRPDSLLIIVFLVALSAFPVTAAGATGRMLITTRYSRPLAVGAVIASLVKVAINLLLISWLGLAGAGIATLIAFSVQAFVQSRAISRAGFPRGHTAWRLLVECLGCCILAGATTYLPQTPVWIVGRVVAGVLLLPFFLLRLRALRTVGSEPAVDATDTPVPTETAVVAVDLAVREPAGPAVNSAVRTPFGSDAAPAKSSGGRHVLPGYGRVASSPVGIGEPGSALRVPVGAVRSWTVPDRLAASSWAPTERPVARPTEPLAVPPARSMSRTIGLRRPSPTIGLRRP